MRRNLLYSWGYRSPRYSSELPCNRSPWPRREESGPCPNGPATAPPPISCWPRPTATIKAIGLRPHMKSIWHCRSWGFTTAPRWSFQAYRGPRAM